MPVNIKVSEVKINPGERVRKDFTDYREHEKYIGLKSSILKFGVRNPISLKSDYLLVEGFYRLSIVMEIGWEYIPAFIDDLTEREALELELQENLCRKNFNNYSVYYGLSKLKEIYEKEFPDTKKGKYDRTSNKIQDHKTISASDALMNLSQSTDSESFIAKYSKELGIARRTIFQKVQIGDAIRTGKFSEKTIKAIENDSISERQLLDRLRRIENKRIINEKLNNVINSDTKTQLPTNAKPEQKQVKVKIHNPHDKIIQDQIEKVKKDELSPTIAKENITRIESLNKSIREISNKNFKKAGEKYTLKKKKEEIPQDHSLGKMYICKRCRKATLVGVEVECEKCKHLNLIYKVLCDDDFTDGSRKLRDPNEPLCERSPDYDLVAKAQFLKIRDQ